MKYAWESEMVLTQGWEREEQGVCLQLFEGRALRRTALNIYVCVGLRANS